MWIPRAVALLLCQAAFATRLAGGEIEVVAPAGTRVGLRAPALRRDVVVDTRGRAWFPQLRAGGYDVTISGQLVGHVFLQPGQCRRITPATADDAAAQVDCTTAPGVWFPAEGLRDTPRPGDVWSVLRDVPGVVDDRVNVGGSETAQQSVLVSHGDGGAGAVWTLDGVDVTDPAAVGTSLVFPDLASLAGLEVRTSALDVRVRTPGVQVGIHTREPAERLRGSAHVRGATDALESDNLPARLAERVFLRNQTQRVGDLGAEAGGRVPGTGLWLQGAFARSALEQQTLTEHQESLRTTSATLAARFRVFGGATSLLGLRNEKVDQDRDTTLSAAPAARWRQSGPTWLLAGEHTRTLAGTELALRLAYLDGGFRLAPQGGTSAPAYEDLRGVFQGSYLTLDTHRPRLQAGLEAERQAWRFGFQHHLLAGLGLRRSVVTTHAAWPGNGVLGLERQSVFFRAFQLTGFAQPTRDEAVASVQEARAAYLQDEARRGRFGVTLGLRLERQAGHNLASAVSANPVVPEELPALAFPGSPTRLRWLDLLPRVGARFDLDHDGREVVGLHYAAYAAELGASDITFDNPLAQVASETYYWLDRNGDHTVQAGEIDRLRGRLGSSGIDPDAPGSAASPNQIDPATRAPRTHELALTLAHARSEALHASVSVAWRRQVGTLWRPLLGLTLADYAVRGAVTGTLFDVPYSVGYSAPASTSRLTPGFGRVLTNRDGYHQSAFVSEVALSGRHGRFDWQASAAFTDWREHFSDVSRAVQDPTPIETDPLLDAGALAVRVSGLGRSDIAVGARWTAAAGLGVRLPWRVQAGLHARARDGFPIPYFQVASTGDPTAGAKNVLVARALDAFRLRALVLVDGRLAREIGLGRGALTLTLECFNLLNVATTLQVVRDVELPNFDQPREIVRPRIVWLGAAYRF